MWFLTNKAFEGLPIFGSVDRSLVRLNPIGEIVRECWQRVPDHFPHACIDDFIVMPNHMHSILGLSGSTADDDKRRERFGAPVRGSVATVVRSFKAAVTKEVRSRLGAAVDLWQKGYFARRIVDQNGLDRARRYIRLNPERWTPTPPPVPNAGKEMTFVKLPITSVHWDSRGAKRPIR